MPRRPDIRIDRRHRLRPDRDRPGLRVRLLRAARRCACCAQEGSAPSSINSNPATIMTDPGWADRTYLEPLDVEGVAAVLRRERPDALLPTLGGQTALNLASRAARGRHPRRARRRADRRLLRGHPPAEDRELFAATMARSACACRTSVIATVEEARRGARVRRAAACRSSSGPAFTLGGHGGGFAETPEEFERGRRARPAREPDRAGAARGVGRGLGRVRARGDPRPRGQRHHRLLDRERRPDGRPHRRLGHAWRPAQTLSDREYQMLRDAAAAVIRAVGVETGGSNVQFALNRETGELVVIEMNPRVSRSSALASKATGYPIAKVATKLPSATRSTRSRTTSPARRRPRFEPTLDYVVVKLPRFAFEKFPGADDRPDDADEVASARSMGIGRTFSEAWGKAMRSRELDRDARAREGSVAEAEWDRFDAIQGRLRRRGPGGARRGVRRPPVVPATSGRWSPTPSGCSRRTPARGPGRDRWRRLKRARAGRRPDRRAGRRATRRRCARLRPGARRAAGVQGGRLVRRRGRGPGALLLLRLRATSDELARRERPTIVILGAGPNRIGQGIEFDYCCVRAAADVPRAGLRRGDGQLQPRDGLDRRRHLRPALLRAAHGRGRARGGRARAAASAWWCSSAARRRCGWRAGSSEAGVPILGTPFAAIDLAEDRERFGTPAAELGLRAPEWGIGRRRRRGRRDRRPDRLPGARAAELRARRPRDAHLRRRALAARRAGAARSLVDRFVEDAIEIDVDAICDGDRRVIGAVMEHVEEAGMHSGDSACVSRRMSLGERVEAELRRQTAAIAEALGVRGLINVQFAAAARQVYVIEANPRAVGRCRSWPRRPARPGRRRPAGRRSALAESTSGREVAGTSRQGGRAAVPALPGRRPALGPEMRSTGEVMGIGPDFATAFAKAERAPAGRCRAEGSAAFLSVCDRDKPAATMLAARLHVARLRARARRRARPARSRRSASPSRPCARSPRARRTSST